MKSQAEIDNQNFMADALFNDFGESSKNVLKPTK